MMDGAAISAEPWDPSEPNAIDCLQVVYKIAERCNLNCSYCYYYNMGDDSAMQRPARASLGTTLALARWLAEGVRELGIRKVRISFHGGEPMLVRATEFARACDTFLRIVGPVAELHFSIQTNGTLLTEGWLEALKRYRVAVGVSIDGARGDHDRFRLDHQGRSSFAPTQRAIRRLVDESAAFPSLLPGTISVLDANVDYRATYRYLRGLGIRSMHFLLPDRNADDRSPASDAEAATLGAGLLGLFEEWLSEDDPGIDVRFIRQALAHFQTDRAIAAGPQERKSNQILVARSDRTVAIDDSLIPALEWYSATPEFAIERMSLRDVLHDPIFMTMESVAAQLPGGCTGCEWAGLCHGGDLENRYSETTGFDNPSIYCESYKTLYAGICRILMDNGYPEREIHRRFGDLQHA